MFLLASVLTKPLRDSSDAGNDESDAVRPATEVPAGADRFVTNTRRGLSTTPTEVTITNLRTIPRGVVIGSHATQSCPPG